MNPLTKKFFAVILFSCCCFVTLAQQQITISGSDFQDATILLDTRSGMSNIANTNYGTYTRNSATAWTNSGSNTFWRSLIYFNLSAIPDGSFIQSATLYFYSDPAYSSTSAAEGNSQLSGSNAIYLQPITSPWDYSQVTWNNQPSTTTTNRVSVSASTSTTENRVIDLTSMVQSWINDPALYFGMEMILQSEVKYRSRNYASSDHPNSALRPKLIVSYTPPATDPITCASPDITTQQAMALPWYGNETFLQNFYDSVQNAGGGTAAARTNADIESPKMRIPVHFWIYQKSSTDPGGTYHTHLPNELDLQNMMDNLNNACRRNGLNFRYRVKQVDYISNESDLILNGITEAGTIAAQNWDDVAVNVHVVDHVAGDNLAGVTYNTFNAIFVDRGVGAGDFGTFTHEMGHFFGLVHTHIFRKAAPCWSEPVSRTIRGNPCSPFPNTARTCSITGDMLCDTPADPNMSKKGSYDADHCTWNPNGAHDWLWQTYQTDPLNYMADGNNSCRSKFSTGQRNIMYYWGLKVLKHSTDWSPQESNRVDIYEPDEDQVAARPIVLGGTIQSHTFHTLARADNVDWLSFVYGPNGSVYNYKLIITQVSTNAVGTVNIWTTSLPSLNPAAKLSGVTMATVGNQLIYSIPCSSLRNNLTYKIEIRRGTGSGTLDYDVQFVEDNPATGPIAISGPTSICSNINSTFTVSSAPAGASIFWTPSGNLTYVSGQGTANYVVKGNTTTTTTGFVSVSVMGGCGTEITPNYNINILPGAYSSSDYPVNGNNTACANSIMSYSTNTLPGATSYNWFWPNGWIYQSGQGTPNLTVQTGGSTTSGNVGVRVNNACGSAGSPSTLFVNVSNCGFSVMSASPNPASSQLTVQSTSTDANATGSTANSASQQTKKINVFSVKLIDGNSVTRKEASTTTGKLTLDTSDLPENLYILQISTADQTYTEQILIKR